MKNVIYFNRNRNRIYQYPITFLEASAKVGLPYDKKVGLCLLKFSLVPRFGMIGSVISA